MTSMKNIGSSDFDGFDSPIMTGCSPGREKGAIMLYETLPSWATKVFNQWPSDVSSPQTLLDAKRNRIDYLLQEGNNSNENLKMVL